MFIQHGIIQRLFEHFAKIPDNNMLNRGAAFIFFNLKCFSNPFLNVFMFVIYYELLGSMYKTFFQNCLIFYSEIQLVLTFFYQSYSSCVETMTSLFEHIIFLQKEEYYKYEAVLYT